MSGQAGAALLNRSRARSRAHASSCCARDQSVDERASCACVPCLTFTRPLPGEKEGVVRWSPPPLNKLVRSRLFPPPCVECAAVFSASPARTMAGGVNVHASNRMGHPLDVFTLCVERMYNAYSINVTALKL
ncbi:unnamed protein product [Lampetra fluviatilis]